jgi:hypothetical protein
LKEIPSDWAESPIGRKTHQGNLVWLLLTGVGLLGGCSTTSGYKPTLPDSCVWTKFPYTWICVDPEEGKVVPKQETELWGPYPLSMLEFTFPQPLQPVDILNLRKEDGVIDWKEVVENNMNPVFALRRWAMFGEL